MGCEDNSGTGHDGVMRILQEREGTNPYMAGTVYGSTPLSLATQNGHEGIVKTPLERNYINNNLDRTPLS